MTLSKRVLSVLVFLSLPLFGGCMAVPVLMAAGAIGGASALSKHDERAAINAQRCQAVTQKAINEGLKQDGLNARLKEANCPI